jgi:hypothetical protein
MEQKTHTLADERENRQSGGFLLICLDKGVSTKFVRHDNSHQNHKFNGMKELSVIFCFHDHHGGF